MKISEDKKKYLNYYFEHIQSLNGLRISAIKDMAKFKGQGAEYASCCFDPSDEDYREGYVTLLFWEPAVDEDTMVFIENNMFYEKLIEVCDSHIAKVPSDKILLTRELNQIKRDLSIQ